MTDLAFRCDWPPLCPHVYATQEELDAHSREHWAKEEALNAHLRAPAAMPDACTNNR